MVRSTVIPITDPDVRKYFGGVDFAFSAAGYNTYEELLAAYVPTAFYAQQKGMDRQDVRVEIGVQRGWHLQLENFDRVSIEDTLMQLQNYAIRGQMVSVLRARRPQSYGSLIAAVELIKLHSSIKNSSVSLDHLYVAAALRKGWPAAYSESDLPASESRDTFVRAGAWIVKWYQHTLGSVQQRSFLDSARIAYEDTGRTKFSSHLAHACVQLEMRRNAINEPMEERSRSIELFREAWVQLKEVV